MAGGALKLIVHPIAHWAIKIRCFHTDHFRILSCDSLSCYVAESDGYPY